MIQASDKDEIDSLGDAEPMFLFRGKLFASGRGQFVIARFAIVIGHAPFRFDPALRFQTVKRRIKRALLDTQNVLATFAGSDRRSRGRAAGRAGALSRSTCRAFRKPGLVFLWP